MSKTMRSPAYRKTARWRNPLTGAEIMSKGSAHGKPLKSQRHAARQKLHQELEGYDD